MVYLKWVLLMAPSFFMAIVGRLLAPFLPPFADEAGYLHLVGSGGFRPPIIPLMGIGGTGNDGQALRHYVRTFAESLGSCVMFATVLMILCLVFTLCRQTY